MATRGPPGAPHRGPGDRALPARPAGARSRPPPPTACRRTRHRRRRSCWASAPSTGWRASGSRRGSCGSTGPWHPRRDGRFPDRSRRSRRCGPDAGDRGGDRRSRLDGPVVPDPCDRTRLADPALGHRRPRDGGLGGMDDATAGRGSCRSPSTGTSPSSAWRSSACTSSRPSATATSRSAWPTR